MNIKNKMRKRAQLKRKQKKKRSHIRNIGQTGSSKFEFRKSSNAILYKRKYIEL